jgi:hypothetical protein
MNQKFITIFFILAFLCRIFPQLNPVTQGLSENDVLKQVNHHTVHNYSGMSIPDEFLFSQKIYKTGSINQTFYVDTVFVYTSTGEQRVIYSYSSAGIITETFYQKLNGSKWENFQRISNIFDSNGNLINYSQEVWQNNQWLIQLRSTFTYNSNGQVEQRLIEQPVNNILTNGSLTTYTYNNNITVIFQNWQNNNWVNYSKDIYDLDGLGNQLSDTHQEWQSSTWINIRRFLSTYDGNSNLLSRSTELWNDNWENGYRETYTYDGNNNMLTSLNEKWDINLNNWVGEFRKSISYDVSNNILQQTNEVYEYTDWTYTDRNTYVYDANENLLSNLYEAWLNGQWSKWGFYTYTYDSHNNLLTSLYQLWNSGQWGNINKQAYEYDSFDNLTTGYYYSWLNSSWTQSDGSLIFHDSSKKSFGFFGYKITVSYKTSITSVTNEKVTPISYSLAQNYPNPFNPTTTINYQIPQSGFVSITLYDILGKEITTLVNEVQSAGSYLVNFDGKNLQSGIYFYSIQAGDFVETKKMLLLK